MITVPNRAQKANYSIQQWHSHRLDCYCLSKFILTMNRGDDSTRPCPSPTPTANGCDWNPPPRTQTSKQGYNDLATSNRRPSKPYSRNTPGSFYEEPGSMFSPGRQNMYRRLGVLPEFLENLLGSKILVFSDTARANISPDIIQFWFNYFATSFSRFLACIFPRGIKREIPG